MNHLIGLGKIFDKEELNIKVLKCLDRAWQPKVTAITESKDLTTLNTMLRLLFGKCTESQVVEWVLVKMSIPQRTVLF